MSDVARWDEYVKPYHIPVNREVNDAESDVVKNLMEIGYFYKAVDLVHPSGYYREGVLRCLHKLVAEGVVESFGRTSGKRWRRVK